MSLGPTIRKVIGGAGGNGEQKKIRAQQKNRRKKICAM